MSHSFEDCLQWISQWNLQEYTQGFSLVRNLATYLQLRQQTYKPPWKMRCESKAWTCRGTYYWNLSGIKAQKPPCTRACAHTHSRSPPGPGRWFGRGSRGAGQHEELGKARQAEESKATQSSLWIQWNSSPPPRLLWEASGACGESEVRRGLSGTKLQIHMICLAKRVKEKWIKAWRDQRNATIKSRRLPWDQQEMHIIYKLFFGSVRCGGNWLLLFGGWAAAGGG